MQEGECPKMYSKGDGGTAKVTEGDRGKRE